MYAIRCGVHRRWKASWTPARPKSSVTAWSPGYSGPAPVDSCTRCPSVGLAGPVADGVDDPLDGLGDGHAVVLAAVAETEGHRARLGVVPAGDQHERDLVLAGCADLLRETVRGDVHFGADAGGLELVHDVEHVVVEGLRHRDAHHLDRCQPGGEGTGVVLGEHAHEALHRAEQGAVD